jgi:hypothetical protein
MPDVRRKEFYYKRAVFSQAMDGATLESVLRSALEASPKPWKRRQSLSQDERTFCFINYSGNHGVQSQPQSMLGAELFSFTQGADQTTILVDENASQIELGSLHPGKNKEFLEGNLYFGVLHDHVIVMQSAALRFSDLEHHLNWLFARHTNVIEAGNGVSLIDPIPQKIEGHYGDTKGIVLRAPIDFDASAVPTKSRRQADAESPQVQFRPKGRGCAALQAMLGESFDLPGYLRADDLLKSRTLQVQLELRWKRAPEQDTFDLMASIAHNLRHVTSEIDYSIQTKTGDITRDDFKLHRPANIEWLDGRPRLDILFKDMLEWLVLLVENGSVRL